MSPDPGAVLSGLLIMGAAAAVGGVGNAAARGRLGRNRWAGIRLPSTMASDEAWVAGHAAASPTMVGGALVSGTLGFLGAVLGLAGWPAPAWTLVIASMTTTLGSVLWAAVMARRAARALHR